MSQENVEIVEETNAALNSRDVDAAMTRFAPDAELRQLASDPGPPRLARGTEQIRDVWALWVGMFDDLHIEVEEIFAVGEAVVVCASRWTGHGTTSGIPVDVRALDVYELRDRKIIRAMFGYRSYAEALKAVGLSLSEQDVNADS